MLLALQGCSLGATLNMSGGRGPITEPENVTDDPSVPGGKVGHLFITRQSSQQLLQNLDALLDVEDNNATIIQAALPNQDSNEQCGPAGGDCLRMVYWGTGVHSQGFSNTEELTLEYFPDLVVFSPSAETWTPGVHRRKISSAVFTAPVPLEADSGLFALFGGGCSTPPCGGSVEDMPLNDPSYNGDQIGIRVSPLGVSPPPNFVDRSGTGLWFDMVLKTRSGLSTGDQALPFSTYPSCQCCGSHGVEYSDMPKSSCERICGDSKFRFYFCGISTNTTIHRLHLSVGFVPEVIPGCNPRDTLYGGSMVDDPVVGWMPFFPGGTAYRQRCVRLKVVAHSRTSVGGPALPGLPESDITLSNIRLTLSDGSEHPFGHIAGIGVEVLDDLFGSAGSEIYDRFRFAIESQVYHKVAPALQPMLTYAPNANVLKSGPLYKFEPHDWGCSLSGGSQQSEAECQQNLIKHFLPASIDYQVYDWMFQPLGPAFPQHPTWQFPVSRIQPVCPDGTYWADSTFTGPGGCINGPGQPVPDVPIGLDVQYLADPDNDGLVGADDNCQFVFNPDQADFDNDGVGDVCDSCRLVSNPKQLDEDLDGDGLAECSDRDLCPCDPVSLGTDDDGVCNYCDPSLKGPPGSDQEFFCQGYCQNYQAFHPGKVWEMDNGLLRIDNCPNVNNPAQENCNLDAEVGLTKQNSGLLERAEVLGDACDPVPCPSFRPKLDEVLSSHTEPIITGNVHGTQTVQIRAVHNIEVRPIGAHNRKPFDPTAPEERAVEYVPGTKYRFCFDIPGQVDCRKGTWVDSRWVHNKDTRDEEKYTGPNVWHRVTMSGLASPSWNPDVHDYSLRFASNAPGMSRVWDWRSDFAYWLQRKPLLAQPIPQNPGDGHGRFWIHSDTEVGETIDPWNQPLADNNEHWRHQMPDAHDPTIEHNRLVSHYEDLTVIQTVIENHVHELPIDMDLPWKVQFCPECPEIPLPNLQDGCPQCGVLAHVRKLPQRATQIVVDLGPSSGHQLGVLSGTNRMAPIADRVGEHLQQTLSEDVAWASPAEPSPTIGQGTSSPALVALTGDGTGVRDTVYLAQGHMLDPVDIREAGVTDAAPSETDALGGQQRTMSMSTPSASVANQAPRRGFVSVYSRSTARVFVVGGELLSSGQNAGDILVGDLKTRSWSRLDLGGDKLGKVLAATYSFADGRVWVLDEVRKHGRKRARLMRVDPNTGAREVVAQWPRMRWGIGRLFDKHWLVSDQDGAVLVVASSAKLRKHMMVRVSAPDDGAPQVEGVKFGRRALATAPVVDSTGYTFVFSRRQGKKVSMKHQERIRWFGGRWSHVGRCL